MNLQLNQGESLTAVLSGSATTTNPTVVTRYSGAGGLKKSIVQLSGATAVTLVTAEGSGFVVSGLSVYNIDTAAVTLTLSIVVAGVSTTIRVVTLQVGDALTIDANGSASVLDTNGKSKQTTTSTSTAAVAIAATEWRKTDGVTVLPVTAATTNHGLVYGTDGTDFPHLETLDGKNATTIVVSRMLYRLPSNYVAGSAITVRVRCGMKTTVASNSGATTVGLNVYSNSGVGNLGSADLNTTAAQSCNSLTSADKDFVITPTGLVAGQDIHIKLTQTVTDSATGTAVIGTINHVELRLSTSA